MLTFATIICIFYMYTQIHVHVHAREMNTPRGELIMM